MSPTLPQITAACDRLSERNRILLLEYLADRWGIELDTQNAALEWAKTQPGTNLDDELAGQLADDLIPQGLCGALIWKTHRETRDAELTYRLGGAQTHVRAA